MDKKTFEEFVKTHCVTEEPVWTETVYESELDLITGLEQIVAREVVVQGPLQVKQLKPHIHACTYCEKTVTDQQVQIRVAQDPVPHWRTRCHTCKHYIHPETKKPILDPHLSSALSKIATYHKNKKMGLKQFKTPKEKVRTYNLSTMNTSGREINTEIEESDNSTITRYFYSDNK
jgi:hypothetical protein